jgi:acyl-coenzyme A thioesterase PaaI-like protein
MSWLTVAEKADFFSRAFLQTRVMVEAIRADEIYVAREVGPAERRSGGTVSSPVTMTGATVALNVPILRSKIGLLPLAVTTSLPINFLHKPSAERRILGRCGLMKLGKILAVGDVWIYWEGLDADRPNGPGRRLAAQAQSAPGIDAPAGRGSWEGRWLMPPVLHAIAGELPSRSVRRRSRRRPCA